jgi:hemerythrin-like domain-containing protein
VIDMDAIRIIHAEHRSLAAVLQGMLYLTREIRYAGAKPNFDVLGAMNAYINAFTDRFHHPKEDRYLFRLLRVRHPSAASLLDRLEAEHKTSAEKIRALEQALAEYQRHGAAEFGGFALAVAGYAAFHYDHMRAEEAEVLPLAKIHLTPSDWEEIDAAFTGHSDPLVGVEAGAEFDRLFRRIVNLAPPPLGVGPTS